ncbi:MAG TPA: hypothetical protein VF681_10145 [Abditibacteriaceae bacterium]|jgi:hypothetical protein
MEAETPRAKLARLTERRQHWQKARVLTLGWFVLMLLGFVWAMRELLALRPNGDWGIVCFSTHLLAAIGALVYTLQELKAVNKQIQQLEEIQPALAPSVTPD